MKTREEHRREAIEILRVLTQYRSLKKEQILRLFPNEPDKIKKVIALLLKQGRIFYIPQQGILSVDENEGMHPNDATILSFWVMLDFWGSVEYHYAGDFPIQLGFLAHGELYEVIYAPLGQETLITQAVSALAEVNVSKRLVLVDEINQIEKLPLKGAVGYVTVSPYGTVQYYRLE